MILETFIVKNMKVSEAFTDASGNSVSITGLVLLLLLIIVISIFYTFGAVSLSWNYNNYVGTSTGAKILYAILVFLFPSFYYPVYAWFLNPIKSLRSRNNSVTNIRI